MGDCRICVVALETGSWPVEHKGSHCPDCHRSWAGRRESHCPGCHAHFSADSVGDKHRRKGACLTREEMLTTQSEAGVPVFRVDTTPRGEIWRHGATLTVKPAYLVGRVS